MVIREEGPEPESSKRSWSSGAWGRESESGEKQGKINALPKEDESRFPRFFAGEMDRFTGNSKELEVVDANFRLPS